MAFTEAFDTTFVLMKFMEDIYYKRIHLTMMKYSRSFFDVIAMND